MKTPFCFIKSILILLFAFHTISTSSSFAQNHYDPFDYKHITLSSLNIDVIINNPIDTILGFRIVYGNFYHRLTIINHIIVNGVDYIDSLHYPILDTFQYLYNQDTTNVWLVMNATDGSDAKPSYINNSLLIAWSSMFGLNDIGSFIYINLLDTILNADSIIVKGVGISDFSKNQPDNQNEFILPNPISQDILLRKPKDFYLYNLLGRKYRSTNLYFLQNGIYFIYYKGNYFKLVKTN